MRSDSLAIWPEGEEHGGRSPRVVVRIQLPGTNGHWPTGGGSKDKTQAGRSIFFIVFQYATEEMFISCLSPCGWCKARRVMVERAENIWARSRVSRRLRHQWLAETFASTARGLSWFLWVRTATNNVSWKEHTTLLYLFFNDNRGNRDNREIMIFLYYVW